MLTLFRVKRVLFWLYCSILICLGIFGFSFLATAQPIVHQKLYDKNAGLPEDHIVSIVTDSKGMLWVLGRNTGLFSFDGQKAITYPIPDSLSEHIGTIFNHIRIDKQNRLWIFTNNGLVFFKNGKYEQAIISGLKTAGIGYDAFLEANDGSIWIGSIKGTIAKVKIGSNGNYFLKKKWQVGTGDYAVQCMAQFNAHTIIAGVIYKGLFKIDIKNNSIQPINSPTHIPNWSIWEAETTKPTNGVVFSTSDSSSTSILEIDKNFNISLVKKSNRFSNSRIFKDSQTSIYKNGNDLIVEIDGQKITFTNNGEIAGLTKNGNQWWLATTKGLVNVKKLSIKQEHFTSEGGKPFGPISTMANTDRHLYLLNQSGEIFAKNMGNFGNELEPSGFALQSKYTIEEGAGVSSKNPSQGVVYQNPHSLKYYFNSKLSYEMPYHKIGISMILNAYTYIGDTAILASSRGLVLCTPTSVIRVPLVNDSVLSFVLGIAKDKSNKVWVATTNGVYSYFKGKVSYEASPYWNQNSSVLDLKADNAGNLFFAVQPTGIVKRSVEGHYTLTANEGSGLANTNFNFITLDNANRLWVLRNNGLSVINETGKARLIFNPEINNFLSHMLSDLDSYFAYNKIGNSMLILANKQLFSFNPDSVYNECLHSTLYPRIMACNVLGKKPYKLVLPSERKTFSYANNSLELVISATNTQNLQGVELEYFLQGGENDYWASTKNTELIYRDLQPGNYSFRLRIKNMYLEDGSQPESIWNFTILPPWYRTWWAYTLYGLIIVSGLFLLYKDRIRRINIKHTLEKMRVSHELANLKAQLNPHFVQNAFKILYYKLDEPLHNEKNAKEYVEQLSKYFRKVIKINAAETHSLEDELDFTEEYLILQKILSPTSFAYQIQIDENVDTLHQKVPTMLMQPFVENCFKHAFTHSTSDNYIHIHCATDERHTFISISDNGKGLKPTLTLGVGTKVSKDKLRLFNSSETDGADVTIFNNTNGRGITVQLKLSKHAK